jgi:hypothetical protein
MSYTTDKQTAPVTTGKPAEQDTAKKPVSSDKEPTTPAAKKEYGGPKGPEPTRYGDWEKNGRCSDF